MGKVFRALRRASARAVRSLHRRFFLFFFLCSGDVIPRTSRGSIFFNTFFFDGAIYLVIRSLSQFYFLFFFLFFIFYSFFYIIFIPTFICIFFNCVELPNVSVLCTHFPSNNKV
ncbi:hypothetical protein PUN28_015093 [Cardiocondyla obscurior]|uniref:Uncharacterized protein n=1 Tax=Cardiocondyla obscurior TaxID=286306 RepID=A0AAW2EZB4_9HYME